MATPDTLSAVNDLQTVLAYQFTNSKYLHEALRAAGSGHGATTSSIDGNKRLAHLGDAIMKVAVLEVWYASGAERGLSA